MRAQICEYLLAVLVNLDQLGRGRGCGNRQATLARELAGRGGGLGAGQQVGGGISLLRYSLMRSDEAGRKMEVPFATSLDTYRADHAGMELTALVAGQEQRGSGGGHGRGGAGQDSNSVEMHGDGLWN